MKNIPIIPADIKDASDILALQKTAYLSEARLYNDMSIPPMIQTLPELAAEFKTSAVLKAVHDGHTIGSVRAVMDQDICCIGRLIVDIGFQGRGIGTRLMKAIEEHCSHARVYELFTGDKSHSNLSLYRRLGYVRTRTQRLSDRVSLVYMEKQNHEL